MHPNINYFHILFVFPMLLYISYTSVIEKKPVPFYLGYFLFLFSLGGIAFHGRRLKFGDSSEFFTSPAAQPDCMDGTPVGRY